MLSKITVSPSPHISQPHSTRSIMGDVIIALVPAMIAAFIFFKTRALVLVGVCVATCVVSEWLCNLVRKKPNSLDDLSAVVTGIILAFSVPPALPAWAAVIGSAFAVIIGKMVFGGLGANIFNPAMVGRAFLAACFGMLMTTWTVPATLDPAMPKITATGSGAITQATPLAWSKQAIKKKVDTKVVTAQGNTHRRGRRLPRRDKHYRTFSWGAISGAEADHKCKHTVSRFRLSFCHRRVLPSYKSERIHAAVAASYHGWYALRRIFHRHRPGNGPIEHKGDVDIRNRHGRADNADSNSRRIPRGRDVRGSYYERRYSADRPVLQAHPGGRCAECLRILNISPSKAGC